MIVSFGNRATCWKSKESS